jgi:CBS domain-containing protein
MAQCPQAKTRHSRRDTQQETTMPITAAEIMTSPAFFVGPHASVENIVRLLAEKHISAVPVCNPDGTLAGIITEKDVLRPFRESVRKQRDWWLGVLAEGERLSQDFLDYLRRDTRTADELMVRNVVTATESTTLPELAELMVARNVKRIPILRDKKLVGIVARADLIAAIARSPGMLV